MQQYVVAFGYAEESDKDYDSVPNAIYNIDENAMMCFENVWVLKSELNAKQIGMRISEVLNGRLMVMKYEDVRLVGFPEQEVDYLESDR